MGGILRDWAVFVVFQQFTWLWAGGFGLMIGVVGGDFIPPFRITGRRLIMVRSDSVMTKIPPFGNSRFRSLSRSLRLMKMLSPSVVVG